VVAAPQLKRFASKELVEIATSLKGAIYEPDRLQSELRNAKHWLKVEQNEKGMWKKPFHYWNGKPNPYNWQVSLGQRGLDEVLGQLPEGKAGFHARNNLAVIDLDDVIDPRSLELREPIVQIVIDYLKTPVYLSSSGRSLHIPFFIEDSFSITDAPGRNLSYRQTDGKSGQFLGGNYPSFVAFTGVALPKYADSHVVEVNEEMWNWIRETLWSKESSMEPPKLSGTPVKESHPRHTVKSQTADSPFGIKWKPNYLAHVKNLLNWREPQGMADKSHSGWSWQWLLAYFRGAESATWDGAVELSKRFEGYFDRKAPTKLKYQRAKHPRKWHEANADNALRKLFDNGDLVLLTRGEKLGKTPAEDQILQANQHLRSCKMKPAAKIVFLEIVSWAGGRERVLITNRELAERARVGVATVKRAKNEFSKHECLEITRNNLYHLKLDRPCNPELLAHTPN